MAAQAGLCLAWSETSKDTFSHVAARVNCNSFSCACFHNDFTVDCYHNEISEPRHDKTYLQEFPTRPDTNRPAQPQKLARVLKFRL